MIKDGNLISDSIRIKADDEPDFSRMVYFLSSRGALDFVKTMDKNHLLNENDLANSLMKIWVLQHALCADDDANLIGNAPDF